MALRGINVSLLNTSANKVRIGLAGITVSIEGFVPVRVLDYKGRGVPNVLLSANNAGGLFSTTTDNGGNALMVLDNPITINALVDGIKSSFNYTGQASVTIVCDSKIME